MKSMKIIQWIAAAILASAVASTVALGYDDTVIEPSKEALTQDALVDYRVQVVDSGFRISIAGVGADEVNSLEWNGSEIYGYVFSGIAGFADYSSKGSQGFDINVYRLPSDLGLENSGTLVVGYADGAKLSMPLHFDDNSVSEWSGNDTVAGNKSNAVAQKIQRSTTSAASCPFLPIGKPTKLAPTPGCGYGSTSCIPGYYHTGIDYAGTGTAVAAAHGTVSRVERTSVNDHGMGNNVILEHVLNDCTKIYSSYSHLADNAVSHHSPVAMGQKIGKTGGTGFCNGVPCKWKTHLHFEMKSGNFSGNSIADSTMKGSDGATCDKENNCWGYVTKSPDSAGWINPSKHIENLKVSNLFPIADYADSNSSVSNPNFNAQFTLKNDTSKTVVIDQIALAVHDSSNRFMFDLGNPATVGPTYLKNPTYLYKVTLAGGSTIQFPISYGGIRAEGNYKVVAKIKIGAAWHELASVDFFVLPPQPALMVSAFSASPTSVAPGGNISLIATSKNQGTAASPSTTTLTYRLSTDATITNSDTSVCTDSVAALTAGATESDSCTVSAPTTTGTYYYGACLTSVSGESSTSNNCSTAVKVTVSSSSAKPDLVVSALNGSSSAIRGSTMYFSSVIKNQGAASANPNYSRAYLSTNKTITTSDTAIWTCNHSSGIAAGKTKSCSGSPTVPSKLTPGTYYLGVIADYSNLIAESDESNNTAYRKITIK